MMKKNWSYGMLLCSSIFLFTDCKKNNDSSAAATEGTSAGKVAPDKTLSTTWIGDASLGNSIWKVATNIDGTGTITTPSDPTYGTIWKFYKPAGSHRTESHAAAGFTAAEGDDIYIGWHSKLDIPVNTSTNAFFQWKAYGDNMLQNYPIVISSTSTGLIHLMHWAPEPNHIGTEVWSATLSRNTWNDYVMRIKVSRNASIGFIEFWYNGVKQTLAGGTQRYYGRTLDAEVCDPKWGVYGGDAASITNYVSGLRIASTYLEAATKVTLYQGCSYSGWAASLGIGNYTMAQLQAAGFTNDDASAIKVPAGMKITVYADNNFGGSSAVLTSDNSCLTSIGFNDTVSSAKITYN